MSDVVGSAAIQFEATGEAEFAAALESGVLAALQAISEQLGTIDGQMAALGGSLSDIGADAGAIGIEVEADTSAAEAELEDFSSNPPPPIAVEVDADTAAIEEVAAAVAAIDGETVTVDVAVDESGGEGLDEVTGKIEDLKTQAIAAAAATFGIGALFAGALEAQGSLESFNLRVGEFADEVNSIDVGGLNEDLGDLAIRLGSSDEEARNAIASLFQVGEAAGLATPDILAMTDNVAALAARAVALNPELGSVGSVIEGLSGGLARGGRFLARYGLSLTAAEINARALNDTGKQTAAELSQVEKQAAGAAIATERLGSTLGDDVAAGADNAQIQLRSVQERLGEITETIGAPLVEPVISGFDSLTSAAEDLTPAMAELAAADVDVAVSLIDVATGSDDASVSLGSLGSVVGDATATLNGIDSVLEAIADRAPILSDALADLVRQGLGPLDSALRAFEITGGIGDAITGGRVASDQIGFITEAIVRAQAETLGLSDAQAENAITASTNTDGVIDLEGAYTRLGITAGLAAEGEERVAAESERTAAILERDAEKAELALAAWVEAIDEDAAQAIQSLESMGVAAQGTVDIIDAAFQDLNEDGTVSLFEFTTTLQEEVAAQAQFVQNIRELQERGASDLALALAEGGEEARAAAAEAVTLSDENLADYERTVDETIAANAYLAATTADLNADIVRSADTTAKDWEKALRSTDLAGAVSEPILEAQLVAEQGGFLTGEAAAEGFELGLISKRQALKIAAKEEAQSVIDTWNSILGVFSPSKVFEEIGEQTIAGFVLGMDAEAAGQSAAEAVASVTPDVGTTASSGANPTIGDINVSVTLPPGVDTSNPVALGEGIGEGIANILGVLVRGA